MSRPQPQIMAMTTHRTQPKGLTRRRFVAIAAATAAAGPLLPSAVRADVPLQEWTGQALGADASISLAGFNAADAHRLFALCEQEVARLERQFSLYLPDSWISRLNLDGALPAAPADFIHLMETAQEIWRQTNGAFDPTVQPLWRVYADHFATTDSEQPPPQDAVDAALARIGFDHVALGSGGVLFDRPGMAITLNGIAQGYITDRIADLLTGNGAEHVLVNIGEYRAIGDHPEGRPWALGLRDPQAPWQLIDTVPLSSAALATSGGYGTRFDTEGRFTHLIDPRSGSTAPRYGSVSVRHKEAAVADGLSTAFAVMPREAIAALVARMRDIGVWIVDRDNRITQLVA